jgi:hypothetical protein
MSKAGYVYVMTNPSMPGLVRIGETRDHPHKRAKQLSRPSGVPSPFRVAFHVEVANSARMEALVHKALNKVRVSSRREFFQLSVPRAIELVQQVVAEEQGSGAPPVLQPEEAAISGACPRGSCTVTVSAGAHKSYCVNGHLVRRSDLEARSQGSPGHQRPAPTQTERRTDRRTEVTAPSCGTCGSKVIARVDKSGNPALRCSRGRCYAKFPVAHQVRRS